MTPIKPSGLSSQNKPVTIAVIPALNVERTIPNVILLTKKYVDYVLVCDDGSSDKTAEVAELCGAIVVKHLRNMGYGAALITLFKESIKMNGDIVITIDSDGQHNPKEIPLLINKMLEDNTNDIVIGSRFLAGSSSQAPKLRNIGIKIINLILSIGNTKVTDSQSGFRAYSKRALNTLVLKENGMGLSTEILIKSKKNGLKIIEVPINVIYNDKSSTLNPVIQGVGVAFTSLKYIILYYPIIILKYIFFIFVAASLFYLSLSTDFFTNLKL
jgi:glycosyltransferase involved in cell wall biosynthesis